MKKYILASYPAGLKMLLCCLVLLTALTGISDAKTLYVIDSIIITVRTGPGTNYKVIASLQTGNKAEKVKEEGDWSFIRFSRDREGWVLSRYLKESPPSFLVVKKLRSEAENNKKLIHQLKQENTGLKKEDKIIRSQFAKIKKSHDDIKEGAKGYLDLKKEHENTKIKLEELISSSQEDAVQNEVLKDVKKIKWFLAGSGATLGGWLIGFIMGHAGRKKKSNLSFSLK